MRYKVEFQRRATLDLASIYDHIADAGFPERADRFVRAVHAACLELATFPQRGASRDDIAPGLRVVGYRRRVSIAFMVKGETVFILGIAYGGRQLKV